MGLLSNKCANQPRNYGSCGSLQGPWQPLPSVRRPSQQRAQAWRRWRSWRWALQSCTLCALLLTAVAALEVLHAACCGMFACYGPPGPLELQFLPPMVSADEDIRSMFRLRHNDGQELTAAATALPAVFRQFSADRLLAAVASGPMFADSQRRIPPIIHQTYKSAVVPRVVRPYMQSWQRLNPGWELRFYDDQACLDFVRREFPEYLAAYIALPKQVERSDFFRYMVVLRYGGVYADLDTECRQPMDALIQPRDTLVACWENEFSTAAEAERRNYVRPRQILQWVFAGAPGHPALRDACDFIARHAHTVFSNNTNQDTLERTGPGIWTDVVLKHALHHTPAQEDDPWGVRILPKVHWGVDPGGRDHVAAGDPRVRVAHHFLGSWKVWWGWRWRPSVSGVVSCLSAWLHQRDEQNTEPLGVAGQALPLYPISVDWQPPFTMLTPLKGWGDREAGDDVAAELTLRGSWQPAVASARQPTAAQALLDSLDARQPHEQVLLDIGAGQGIFSLMAAARGHRVIAMEASPRSLEPFLASIAYSGFDRLVTVHRQPAGAADGQPACLERSGVYDAAVARGYSTAEAGDPTTLACGQCTRAGVRRAATAVVPVGTNIAAVRISAPGWEYAVLDGLQSLIMAQKPGVVLIELYPSKMAAAGGGTASGLLRRMAAWGYSSVSHSGRVCDERWLDIVRPARIRGFGLRRRKMTLRQPTWCKLQPSGFEALASRAPPGDVPENLLFIAKPVATGAAATGGTWL